MDKTVIAALSGAAGTLATVLVNYFLKNRKQDNSDFSDVVSSQWKIIYDQRTRIDKIEVELRELRLLEREKSDEIQRLQSQLVLFESSHSDIPLPMWMKDVDGRMLFVNQHYEDLFLRPMGKTIEDYIGRDDFEIWPKDTAEAYRRNDLEVYTKGREVHTVEEIPDAEGKVSYALILKYPRRFNQKIIGISGMVMRMSREKIDINDVGIH